MVGGSIGRSGETQVGQREGGNAQRTSQVSALPHSSPTPCSRSRRPCGTASTRPANRTDDQSCKFVPFECVELVGGEVQGHPEFVWWREHVEVRRVNELVLLCIDTFLSHLHSLQARHFDEPG